MFRTKSSLVLASGSPRRRDLLTRLGLDYKVVTSGLEENGSVKTAPEFFCQEWAERKAEAVAQRLGDDGEHWFLGVDTIVVVEGRIIGKPESREQGREFLGLLSDRWHEVMTGYCLLHPKTGTKVLNMVRSRVRIKPLSPAEIEAYLDTGEPDDKAGAYAVQGIGAFMIVAIEGSYTNVVGLPLTELTEDLKRLGLIELAPKKG